MRQISLYQKGFSAVEVLMVVAVVAIAGTLGYVYVNRQAPAAKDSAQSATKTEVAVPSTPAAAKVEAASIKSDLDTLDVDRSVDTSVVDEALQ